MGFSVVDPSLDIKAIMTLRIMKNPPAQMLLTCLLDSTPRDQALARKCYEYLASQIASEGYFNCYVSYENTG